MPVTERIFRADSASITRQNSPSFRTLDRLRNRPTTQLIREIVVLSETLADTEWLALANVAEQEAKSNKKTERILIMIRPIGILTNRC